MKNNLIMMLIAGALMMTLGGCGANYRWSGKVPQEYRTVFVPTLRNESDVMESGAVVSRQIAREIQREGTFRLKGEDDAALEIQGRILASSAGGAGYDRRSGMRLHAYMLTLKAEITVVDHHSGKLLIENRIYTGETTFTSGTDYSNAQRDATGRAADDLARKVVDDLLRIDFKEGKR